MTKEQLEAENKKLNAQLKIIHEKYDYAIEKFDELKERHSNLTTRLNDDIYSRAVTHYGESSRLLLSIEEMSELTKELVKRARGRNNMDAISEEIADVEIMLEQLKTLFGNRAEVDCWRAKKLQRLIERMDGHND